MAMNNKNDNRSKKIVFCSSCLLNTNNKVLPLARYGGFSKEFIDILAKYDLGVQQMDCPETLYLGIQRWQHTKNLYDNVGFRRHCRQLAEKEVDYMYSYMQMDYDTVAVLCCDGSPTCGCGLTSWDENWGGPLRLLWITAMLLSKVSAFLSMKCKRRSAIVAYPCLRSMVWGSMMPLSPSIRSSQTLMPSLQSA